MSHAEAVMREVTNDLKSRRVEDNQEQQVIVTKEMLARAWNEHIAHNIEFAYFNEESRFSEFCQSLGFRS